MNYQLWISLHLRLACVSDPGPSKKTREPKAIGLLFLHAALGVDGLACARPSANVKLLIFSIISSYFQSLVLLVHKSRSERQQRKNMKKLLSFKHWQLFLLIVICGAWTSPSPLKEIINSISAVTLIFWLYAVGIYGQNRIEESGLKPMNLKLFKANIIGFGILCAVILIYSASQRGIDGADKATNTFGPKDIFLIAVGLYAVFAVFQTIGFAAKTIAKLEYKREVNFSDYFNNLLLMCFFFIGVWFFQPKVNRLVATE